MKTLLGILEQPPGHWVGDGFPVRSLFSYHQLGEPLSPFLLLDRAGPHRFQPAPQPRGVGEHPHRGFETVTLVYDGEVSHRDSTGQGGTIGPGDVQWMTAGSGILHEEFHSEAFTRQGGTLDMVQLWVNLPARHKMTTPGYQAITRDQIPVVAPPDSGVRIRVVAGTHATDSGTRVCGPARTHSPLLVWDVDLDAGGCTRLPVPDGWTLALVTLHGQARVNDTEPDAHTLAPTQVAVLGTAGADALLSADAPARVLVLAGEPLNEPIVGHGPFVMNTRTEIQQALDDFRSGRFGQM